MSELYMGGPVVLATQQDDITPEQAFGIYMATGARSIRRVALLIGKPVGTVLSWSQRYNWVQQALDYDLEVTEGIATAADATIVSQQLRNIEFLVKTRDDESVDPRVRVQASKELTSQFGEVSSRVRESMQQKANLAELGDSELERMAQTKEGVAEMLRRQRERTGKA